MRSFALANALRCVCFLSFFASLPLNISTNVLTVRRPPPVQTGGGLSYVDELIGATCLLEQTLKASNRYFKDCDIPNGGPIEKPQVRQHKLQAGGGEAEVTLFAHLVLLFIVYGTTV